MDEQKILGISLILSTIGLFILIFVSVAQEPSDISSITPDEIGSRVYLKGQITGLRTSQEGHRFFYLSDGENQIKVAIFKGVGDVTGCIKEGGRVNIRAAVDEYRGELEIIPSKTSDITC